MGTLQEYQGKVTLTRYLILSHSSRAGVLHEVGLILVSTETRPFGLRVVLIKQWWVAQCAKTAFTPTP